MPPKETCVCDALAVTSIMASKEPAMGDKGGKKDKEKSQKQQVQKQKQEVQRKQDKHVPRTS